MKTETRKVIIFTRDKAKVALSMTVNEKPNLQGIYGYALEDNGIFSPASEHPIRMKKIDGIDSYYIDLNVKG